MRSSSSDLNGGLRCLLVLVRLSNPLPASIPVCVLQRRNRILRPWQRTVESFRRYLPIAPRPRGDLLHLLAAALCHTWQHCYHHRCCCRTTQNQSLIAGGEVVDGQLAGTSVDCHCGHGNPSIRVADQLILLREADECNRVSLRRDDSLSRCRTVTVIISYGDCISIIL